MVGMALLVASQVVQVPVGSEVSVPAPGVVEVRVVNPSVARVVRIEKDTVIVRGERAGGTTVFLLTPEGYEEVTLEVISGRGEAIEAPLIQEVEEKPLSVLGMEPLPLSVFIGQPGVVLVAKAEGRGAFVPFVGEEGSSPIEVSLEADKTSALVEEKISLSIKVKANQDLTEAEVRLPIPQGAGYLLGSGGKGTLFDIKTRSVIWKIGSLKAGETRVLPCEVRVLEEVPVLRFVALASAQGVSPTSSEEVQVRAVRLILAAIYALPDTFVVKRNIFSSLSDVKGEANREIVIRLEGLGIVNGYPDKTFKPERHANRAEATKVVLLADALAGMTDHTTISFVLTAPAKVTINIKDGTGRVIRTLLSDQPYDVGQHMVKWDGRDSQGVFVAPGVYTYEVSTRTGQGNQVRLSAKLTLVEAKSYRPSGRPSFRDVPSRQWFTGYIAEAERKGLAKGYSGGVFKPTLPINRAEFTTLVVRAAGLEEEAQKRTGQAIGIADEDLVPGWARGYIAVALSQKLRSEGRPIVGLKEGAFEPLHFVERIEMAAAISRFVDRDTEREVSISGAISPGARVSVNGRSLPIGEGGVFKSRVSLKPGVNVVTIIVK